MFQVDQPANKLKKLEERKFSDLKLREREHLQEWLADMPEALGEELLIIQKEFDGFADTRERLDLLALDKEGRLVIIENKLDDSGRDVVWQAIKYAAYCSNLKKSEIVEIYQKYLDRYANSESATARIIEFLDVETLEETVLNSGNQQRLIFIAAHFRKEVTATTMWLLAHGIQAQCFKVTPYSFADELFIDLQQIIPTPEAADFMIGMATKETEATATQGAMRQSHRLRLEFWQHLLEVFKDKGISKYVNISPSKDHWLTAATGVSGCGYALIFGKTEARVELSLQRSSKEENKWIYDQLYSQKDELDKAFGHQMEWRRMADKISSRIQYATAFDGYNKDNWPDIIEWLGQHMEKLDRAFTAPLAKINTRLKSV